MKLLIVPVDYFGNISKFGDVCPKLLSSFQSVLTYYEILPAMDFSEFSNKSKDGKRFETAWEKSKENYLAPRFRFGVRYSFDSLTDSNGFWIGEHFLLSLDRYVKPGVFVLGLTSLPAISAYDKQYKQKYIYGMGDDLLGQVAFVTAGYPEFKEVDTKQYLLRIYHHALHELGHAMYLCHHRPYPDKNGQYCPMAKFSLQYVRKKDMGPTNPFMKRRSSFCRKCANKLKHPRLAFNDRMNAIESHDRT